MLAGVFNMWVSNYTKYRTLVIYTEWPIKNEAQGITMEMKKSESSQLCMSNKKDCWIFETLTAEMKHNVCVLNKLPEICLVHSEYD